MGPSSSTYAQYIDDYAIMRLCVAYPTADVVRTAEFLHFGIGRTFAAVSKKARCVDGAAVLLQDGARIVS
jgi:hypothetical protein